MTKSELQAALQAAGVVFTVDPAPLDALAKNLADAAYHCQGVVIARGRAATPSRDGRFEPAFSVGIQPGHLNESGTIDFFNRELLKPVQVDDCLGQLHAPISGVPGKRVDGTEIRIDNPRALPLQIGAGVRSAPDGQLYAAISGVIMYEDGRKIDVARQHVHTGDVDLRSGDLDMEGALTVRGSVQHRFTVRATGDIAIAGSVESGSVYGSGKVRIQGGVRGGDSGEVCAEQDIELAFAEGASIRAGGALKLGSAVNCELSAHKIEASRVIRGGVAQAELTLQLQEAGAPSAGTRTLLSAAIPLERPVCDVRAALLEHTELRALLRRAGGVRAADERAKGGKLGRASAASAKKQLESKVELAGRREQLLPSAAVHIRGRLHPGVVIQLGSHCLQIDEPDTNVRFTWDAQSRSIRREGKQR